MSRRRDDWTPPHFSPRLYRWFLVYLRRYARRSFDAVRLSRAVPPPPADPDVPIVVYSNHPSWWDPIMFMLLADACLPGREGYGPMDARALERYGFFRRLGIFGVDLESRRGAVEFLRNATWVLERPGAVLWLTAEGRFTDPRRRPVTLAPGLAHVARSLDRGLLVPLALEYPFWNERLPVALARLGEPLRAESAPLRSVADWQAALETRLAETMDGLAEESRARDPEAFVDLLEGRKGVGGVYDAWRRVRAAARRERFSPAHDEGRG